MQITINTPLGTEQINVDQWVDGSMFVGTDIFGKIVYFDLNDATEQDSAISVYSHFVRR